MKKLFFALLLTAFALNAPAQYISPFFTSMPDDIVDYLSPANRQDLIDLYKAGKIAKVENLLKGRTELKELGDDLLTIQMTASSTFQMKLLPLNDTAKVIAIIETACGPACDSRLRIFSTNWKSLDTNDILPKIILTDFIQDDKKDAEELRALDLPFFSYSFSKTDNALTITLDAKNYLSKNDYKKVEPLIKPVILRWNKDKFVKEN